MQNLAAKTFSPHLRTSSGVIKLIDDLIAKAVEMKASDIHLEPRKDFLKVRYRVDGFLQDGAHLHNSVYSAAISRLKVMVNLDIAEHRLPQDGKTHLKVKNKSIDLRVSTMPTIFGEKAVVRILDHSQNHLQLEELGMNFKQFAEFQKLISKPHGIILITGPTGSGKTTTLYSALNKLNTTKVNIVTIEDPVEYQLPGINQIQVNYKAGLTFAKGLRSILRQDPDIIMIGEIRDLETAKIAIQAAMTGHLVFSTLHTNDASSAVTRLLDMQIEPFLTAASLRGVIAQRLIRLSCKKCADGCQECNFTGYQGRTSIFEILPLNGKIQQLISQKASTQTIKAEAEKEGMNNIRQAGLEKVKKGLTRKEEILRVTLE